MEAVRSASCGAACGGRPRAVGSDDEATLTVVRFTLGQNICMGKLQNKSNCHEHLPMEQKLTQPREKEKVLFYPVVICSRLARVPINMQIGNTHPRYSDRFFF